MLSLTRRLSEELNPLIVTKTGLMETLWAMSYLGEPRCSVELESLALIQQRLHQPHCPRASCQIPFPRPCPKSALSFSRISQKCLLVLFSKTRFCTKNVMEFLFVCFFSLSHSISWGISTRNKYWEAGTCQDQQALSYSGSPFQHSDSCVSKQIMISIP